MRPSQAWDRPRTFLEALTEKYFKVEEAQSDEIISLSRSKHIEEVGFTKFAQRQAELKGIHVLVLDHMQIGSAPLKEHDKIKTICAHIQELDLSGNLFEALDDALSICSLLPKLKRLTLDSNRFALKEESRISLPRLLTISLSNTLLDEDELARCLLSFPHIEELTCADNALVRWHGETLPRSLQYINLSHNSICQIDDIAPLLALPQLRVVSLKDNQVDCIAQHGSGEATILSRTVEDLDLGRNQILDWSVFDYLPQFFPALRSLRVSGNPLYTTLRSAENKALAAEDGYMLTVARLPTVTILNHSAIREKDRLNAEKYYLSQIAIALSRSNPTQMDSVLARHPRWSSLCQEYGEPDIQHSQSGSVSSSSLAARLVRIHFNFTINDTSSEWTMEIPKAHSIYALYGLVGKKLDIMPVNLRLVWETDERDPISHRHEYQGPEWWDSSDDENETTHEAWTMRSVYLIPGTRPIGTYLEGQQAIVGVQLLN